MRIRQIKDECSRCGNMIACELCLCGHGIDRPRSNIAEMVACQLKHMEEHREFEVPIQGIDFDVDME